MLATLQIVGQNLIENMRSANEDSQPLEKQIQEMTLRWNDCRTQMDDLMRQQEKLQLNRKAYEELATLRDVYDGYERYIQSAEPLANDSQTLGLQVETNKVSQRPLFPGPSGSN